MKFNLVCDDTIKLVQKISVDVKRCTKANDEIVVVGILDASYLLVADFIRVCMTKIEGIGFYTAKSRVGTEQVSLSDVQYISGKTTSLEGKIVLLLDVIVSTGKTLTAVRKDIIEVQRARWVYTGALFVADDSEAKRLVDFASMMVLPTQYLVGYGLDLKGRFRDWGRVCELVDESEPDKLQFSQNGGVTYGG